ncbi:sigma 54-interacting transcriptional regulator [Bacillus sp. V3]|nr:sigma 54-interacting transcriptional regulator [Bacillus sp. V3]
MEQLYLDPIMHDDFIVVPGAGQYTDEQCSHHLVFMNCNETIYYLNRDEYTALGSGTINQNAWRKTLSHQAGTPFYIRKGPDSYDVIVVKDSNQKIVGYVTLRDLLQEALNEYDKVKAFLHTIVDTIDNSVSVVDRDGRTMVWTKGAETIFSIQKEDILGKDMKHFFPKEMLLNEETMVTGNSFRHHLHKPREDLFVLINTNPVHLNGEIIGAVAAETDVTSHVWMNQELLHASSKIHELQNEISELKEAVDPFQQIRGSSLKIKKAISLAKKMSKTSANVLLLGETGVGKEVFAKAIHDENRADKPLVALNCGALSPSLFESELFGYSKGAFSGADPNGKIGKIELAGDGTLFLDEVGDLPLDLQVKLLRVLENRVYYSVGGLKVKSVNCRVIAATNKNLEALVQKGEFREDLYYRLNTLTIEIPPLRERKQDILELFHLFLYKASKKYNCDIQYIAPLINQSLLEYEWHGNVRELKNMIERMVLLSENGYLTADLLPEKMAGKNTMHSPDSKELEREVKQYEKLKILEALESEKGNKTEAAKRLGITRATLYNKMRKLNITGFN